MGHRRFARHWSVPQSRGALLDPSQIPLSAEAIEDAIQRSQTIRAARQQAPQGVAAAYRHVEALVLRIDGLQPEHGHETLSGFNELPAVRELREQIALEAPHFPGSLQFGEGFVRPLTDILFGLGSGLGGSVLLSRVGSIGSKRDRLDGFLCGCSLDIEFLVAGKNERVEHNLVRLGR